MTWFGKLMGFEEKSFQQVQSMIDVSEGYLSSKKNGKKFKYGSLEVVSVGNLKRQLNDLDSKEKANRIGEVIGDVRNFHVMSENRGALFQAASQFNLLEMVSPTVTPEMGVGRYENDRTQGPACAISCGAGTIYRNYFVEINGNKGQSANCQIDCLKKIGKHFDNDVRANWIMKNGYAFPTLEGLEYINSRLAQMSSGEYDAVKNDLEVGIHWDTTVTISSDPHQSVNQIYCSALPVGYSDIEYFHWEKFAKLILESTYEATILAAILNKERTGNNKLYLTLVGGGVFGNSSEWLIDSISSQLKKYKNCGLEINFISYLRQNWIVHEIIKNI